MMKKGPFMFGKPFSTLLAFLYFLQKAKTASISSEFAEPQPCLSGICIHAASRILKAIDLSVDPCEDFYGYACNGWKKNHQIPCDKGAGVISELQNQNYLLFKAFLDQPEDAFVTPAEQNAKNFYDSCLDHKKNGEALGAKPMLELLEKLGGWNVSTNNFSITNWSLQNTLKTIHNEHGINALFGYRVVKNRQSDRYTLQVRQGTLMFPKIAYSNETIYKQLVGDYLDDMTKTGLLLGGNPEDTKSQMEAVLNFDRELANILIGDTETVANFHDTARSIDELRTGVEFMDWQAFFEDAVKSDPDNITPKEQIMVSNPDYLEKLTLLLKKYNETEEGRIVLNNYLIWRVVKNYIVFLSKDFPDMIQNLVEASQKCPQISCAQYTAFRFGLVAAAVLVREDSQPDLKTNVEKMLKSIKNAFKANFKYLQWLDKENRKAAETKVDALSALLGYPDSIFNTTFLDEYYKHLTLKRDAHFQNIINLHSYEFKKNLEKVNKPFNEEEWRTQKLIVVNAGYDPSRNLIEVPIGILRKPFYNSKYPDSLNFGGIGTVVGHELTHGFDDEGKDYDKDGNHRLWWSNRTIELFHNRTECIVKQYSQYEVNGRHIDGRLKKNENIADNGGLKAAYHAYLEYAKDKPEPPPLPGLNLNHKQLFFVSFAQNWCANLAPNDVNEYLNDVHTVGKYRVIGTLSNLNEFSEEFKCPVGSRMNPKEKCEVW